jgi:hypothetical protein
MRPGSLFDTALFGTGASAAAMWISKDMLGKVARIAWASMLGPQFDVDAKAWRLR